MYQPSSVSFKGHTTDFFVVLRFWQSACLISYFLLFFLSFDYIGICCFAIKTDVWEMFHISFLHPNFIIHPFKMTWLLGWLSVCSYIWLKDWPFNFWQVQLSKFIGILLKTDFNRRKVCASINYLHNPSSWQHTTSSWIMEINISTQQQAASKVERLFQSCYFSLLISVLLGTAYSNKI